MTYNKILPLLESRSLDIVKSRGRYTLKIADKSVMERRNTYPVPFDSISDIHEFLTVFSPSFDDNAIRRCWSNDD